MLYFSIRVSFLAQMWQKWKCTKAQNKSLFLWKKWTFWIFATEKVSCLKKKKTDGLFIIPGFDHKKWRLTSIGETKIFGFVRFLRLIWALEFPKKTKVLKKCKDQFSFFFPGMINHKTCLKKVIFWYSIYRQDFEFYENDVFISS